jgi:hypothetical protein
LARKLTVLVNPAQDVAGFHNLHRTNTDQPLHDPGMIKAAATVIKLLEPALGQGHNLSRVSVPLDERKQTVLALALVRTTEGA